MMKKTNWHYTVLMMLLFSAILSGIHQGAAATTYTCPMHHQIRRNNPGDCPICSMALVPLEKQDTNALKTKEPHALKGLATVHLSAYKQQLIGVHLITVQKTVIVRVIHATGRFAGGEKNFAALAGDFAAQKSLPLSQHYVVADIYALDIPFIRVGQKAVITALGESSDALAGKVSQIYPYDETQSRMTRVRIDLSAAVPHAMYVNVDITATTSPRLAISPAAIMDTGTQRYVFVQTKSGTFVPRSITVGFRGDNLWEVKTGLQQGEQVVDHANFLIDADSKIKASFIEEK